MKNDGGGAGARETKQTPAETSVPRENLFPEPNSTKTDTRRARCSSLAIGDAVYGSGERAGKMRKDNSDNTGEQQLRS